MPAAHITIYGGTITMKQNRTHTVKSCAAALALMLVLAGCAADSSSAATISPAATAAVTEEAASQSPASTTAVSTAVTVSTSGQDSSDLFSERDLAQTADTSDARTITVSDQSAVNITEEGVYILTGTAENATVTVSAPEDAKVQLVLDGLNVINDTQAVIDVETADKVFITTAENSVNELTVSAFADGSSVDGVIFARCDLTVNGTGTLNITSADNGIVGKDDLKITGSTLNITAEDTAIEANDSISVNDGVLTLTAKQDGLHAENDEDDTKGSVTILGGTLTVNAGDDALHAQTVLQIDGGQIDLSGGEGMEATQIVINDGTITVNAMDDGINAGAKSDSLPVSITINGGSLTVTMSSGDTDAIDSNGDLFINGGTITISAQNPFDYDGQGQLNGGTLIVNGQQMTALSQQMTGGAKGGMRR